MTIKNKFNIISGKMLKIISSKSFYILIALYSISARAEDDLKYPFLSGDILIENRSDHTYSRKTSNNLKANNSFFYVENNISKDKLKFVVFDLLYLMLLVVIFRLLAYLLYL